LNLLDIEQFVDRRIRENGMTPAFYGYKGYQYATCLSVNDEIVHGLPRDYNLASGDIISVDLGVNCNGWMVDTARTYAVGEVKPQLQKLLTTAKQALSIAVGKAKVGNAVGDIGAAIEKTVTDAGFFIVKDLTGHGVGRKLQEPPTVPNYGREGSGPSLKPGMVIAIEPIISLDPTEIVLKPDGWTITADNGTLSAHFEDTVLITEKGPVVLTV
jgi:methionyl aminopeptidase